MCQKNTEKKKKIDSFFKDSKPECILNIEERDQGRWLSATVTWTGWRCREGERVRECGEREGQKAGMVGVTRIEACYWLWKNTLGSGAEREGRRGGRHPLIFEPRFPAGVMATVHRAFSPSVIPPLSCSSLAATQPSLFSSCRLITPSAACWGSSDSMTS